LDGIIDASAKASRTTQKPTIAREELLKAYKGATRRLIVCDYKSIVQGTAQNYRY
jgi:hypothetical protein